MEQIIIFQKDVFDNIQDSQGNSKTITVWEANKKYKIQHESETAYFPNSECMNRKYGIDKKLEGTLYNIKED